MAFTCSNEIEISGGAAEERGAAAVLVLAIDCVDEGSATREEHPGGQSAARGQGAARDSALVLRFESVDGIPEDELQAIAPQFPELSFTLVYFSLDGEFFGYTRAGAAAESADFAEDTRDIVGRRYDGDGIAFVKANYGLARS